MGIRNTSKLAVLLAIVAFGLAGQAFAAITGVPTAYDIEGYYAISGKYGAYDADGPAYEKGSYRAIFQITRISNNEVWLAAASESGQVGPAFRAHYLNGVLLLAWGDDTMNPTSQMESMILEFSGAPGKIKLSGKYFYYYTKNPAVGMDTLKGKMVPM